MSENLIVNGDFSKGNTGFTSTNRYHAPDPNYGTLYDDYSVIRNPGKQWANGYDSFGDHDHGNGGLMLFIDGNNGATPFWSEDLKLAGNITYTFTYFVTGCDTSSLPTIRTTVDGGMVGSDFAVTEVGGKENWQEVSFSITTGNKGTYTLALTDLNTSEGGNDFCVDDIKLRASSPPASHGIDIGSAAGFSHHFDIHPATDLVEHLAIA